MSLYLKNYTKEIQKVINNTKLTKEQNMELDKCIRKLCKTEKNDSIIEIFEDMYKMYAADISTGDIAKVYNKNIRTIQYTLKKLGLERDRFKAQSIAAKKRDYVKIRETRKQTTLNRQTENTLFGTKIESYIRTQLSLSLNKIVRVNGGETIIGINTVTSVGELDIPILILFGDNHYKYGIEVDGNYYHGEEFAGNMKSDNAKTIRLNELGYKIYRLETKAYYNENEDNIKYNAQIRDKLSKIVSDITKDLNNKLHIA